MPVGRFPYQKLAKYPHMKPEDITTWELFIDKHPNEYDSVDYDLPLGDVQEHADLAAELDIAGAERLHKYKVDVIGYKKGSIDIIEVKGKATPSSLGQVITYKAIYDAEYNPAVQTYPLILARSATIELPKIAANEGILLIILD